MTENYAKIIAAFADIGIIAMCIGSWMLLGMIRFQYPCRFCGKINEGNVLQAILSWCDHGGI